MLREVARGDSAKWCENVPRFVSDCASIVIVGGIKHRCEFVEDCDGEPHQCYCGLIWKCEHAGISEGE